MKHSDEVTQVLEEIEMDLRKGNIDFKQADAARAAALAVSYRLAPKMDAALVANAELRAALEAITEDTPCDHLDHHGVCQTHSMSSAPCAVGEARALLSRPDLGAGMVVVERRVLVRDRERMLDAVALLLAFNVTEGVTVNDLRRAVADLDALLKKGGG